MDVRPQDSILKYPIMLLSQSKSVLIFLILMLSIGAAAQTYNSDLELIKKYTDINKPGPHRHNPEFLLSGHPSSFVRYNPATLVFGSLMWLYQAVVSPQFSLSCLYHPSCSGYSMDLISEYGLIPGIIFTSDRLMRCNRLSSTDFNSWETDPVSGKINESTSFYRINE